ncbi:C-type lectin domain family 4 member F-like [Rhineura floridana]|uniref:C-type lectin domain family 4 member F-like n=1 Tax=Rhineura floridana TaxID=261503 RepID=UPI002AC7EDE1|nr:C-type lectin domain family 4 member F-like [Rhineura floridana]
MAPKEKAAADTKKAEPPPPPEPPPVAGLAGRLKKVPPKVKWMLFANFGLLCFASFIYMFHLYISLISEGKNPLEQTLRKLKTTMSEALRNPKINYYNPVKVAEEVTKLPTYIETTENSFNDRKSKYQNLFKKGAPKSAGGWDVFGKSLYYISDNEKSWYDAESFCMSRDSHLASILSDEEQNYITSQLNHPAWIGLTDENEEGNWEWTDGSRFITQYWSHGNPRLSDYAEIEEDCTSIVPSSSGYNWDDANCHELHRWVCKEILDVKEP